MCSIDHSTAGSIDNLRELTKYANLDNGIKERNLIAIQKFNHFALGIAAYSNSGFVVEFAAAVIICSEHGEIRRVLNCVSKIFGDASEFIEHRKYVERRCAVVERLTHTLNTLPLGYSICYRELNFFLKEYQTHLRKNPKDCGFSSLNLQQPLQSSQTNVNLQLILESKSDKGIEEELYHLIHSMPEAEDQTTLLNLLDQSWYVLFPKLHFNDLLEKMGMDLNKNEYVVLKNAVLAIRNERDRNQALLDVESKYKNSEWIDDFIVLFCTPQRRTCEPQKSDICKPDDKDSKMNKITNQFSELCKYMFTNVDNMKDGLLQISDIPNLNTRVFVAGLIADLAKKNNQFSIIIELLPELINFGFDEGLVDFFIQKS